MSDYFSYIRVRNGANPPPECRECETAHHTQKSRPNFGHARRRCDDIVSLRKLRFDLCSLLVTTGDHAPIIANTPFGSPPLGRVANRVHVHHNARARRPAPRRAHRRNRPRARQHHACPRRYGRHRRHRPPTRTDSLGRYILARVPSGPQVLVARRLGYAVSRIPITVAASGVRTIDVVMATSSLQLDQLTVTADRTGRARGELGTASVIDRDAIANQIASSLQGILELVPGVPLQPPGLDAAAQFSLRALATNSTTGVGGISGPGAADIGAAGTLIVLDGVPLSNNANLQSVGVRGETVPIASTAGGGIDLRRIPASTLERVEVIRGIPSARWGDLTQGAIIVDTRAAATPPELAARFDPRTTEGNLVGGQGFQNARQSLTVTGNIAQTASARTLSSATATRGASQIAHRMQFGIAPGNRLSLDGRTPLPRLMFDTRLDWWQLKYSSPERRDVQVGRNSFQDDRGLRLGERARLALGGGTLELTAALDAQEQETRETQIISRPTTPFTDRLTEGRNIGSYVEGPYSGAYQLLGAPRLLYTRLEWDRAIRTTSVGIAQLRFGAEARREWNAGDGYLFNISRPPQASTFNGTAGYDRPRRFSDTPAMATSALYADTRLAVRRGQLTAELQPGVRLETLHNGEWWTTGARSAMVQPRLTQLARSTGRGNSCRGTRLWCHGGRCRPTRAIVG